MADGSVPLLKGTVDLLIMRALAARPTHGYGVMRWIEEATGATLQVDEGSLYPALYRLEDRGWVISEWGTSENNRRARFYRLTPKGRTQLKTDSGEFVRFARAMFLALEVPVNG
jgi:PadR family transcriptional regulator, regulatory protein PadR